MSITILPARLANQIAAGEVVERPASVVKELVENSLDAGATHIQIDIEKGGTKRIRIIDNGKGIVKDELTLALSRHATSKIKNLDDLEAISSLGFRGEALASISSVARLTLTSKPASQDLAWQAYAEGRDMEVVLKPAAHPNGTTIDVVDLFFNTPARRKFLRTEKTEFTHIEEVIKRIALARFDVSFVLNHNGKTVKQYRKIQSEAQNIKRIASVCGQTFVEHAIEINCQHDDIHLSGWIAKPSYTRKQNDLCYSYVNGRMMRDKLINHAIRQAYGEFIDNDVYSAFVLFLSVDFKDVDVNVHPAKHEVRFHQSRYVHDFIYTVCHKALAEQIVIPTIEDAAPGHVQYQEINSESSLQSHLHVDDHSNNEISEINRADRSYVTPLKQEQQTITPQTSQRYNQPASSYQHRNTVSPRAAANYQTLMSVEYDKQQAISNSVLPEAIGTQHVQASPLIDEGNAVEHDAKMNNASIKLLFVHQDKYIVYQQKMKDESRLVMSLITPLSQASQYEYIVQCWRDKTITSEQQALISQPLLLPVKIKLLPEQKLIVEQYQSLLFMSGIHSVVQQNYLQIRQFPALLRAQDVANVFEHLLLLLVDLHEQLSAKKLTEEQLLTQWQQSIAKLAVPKAFTLTEVQQLFKTLSNENESTSRLNSLLSLNSAVIDLTSLTSQLDELLLPSSH